MKKLSAVINSLTFVLLTLASLSSSAQLVGDNAFLQGRYVEAGIGSNGSMGSNRIVPSGYHTRSPSFNFYDPGLGAYSGASASRLMMVYDAGHDGWATGIPTGYGYFGDYSMPGTPYEGWSCEIAGSRGDANFQSFLGTSTGYTLALPMTGTVTGYTNAAGTMTGTWQGTAGTGAPLSIKQKFILDTNASWVRVTVTLKNTSASTLTGVYYMRHCDPDNDQYISGNFNTLNTINYQNDYYHRVMVTAAGTYFTTQTLSLMTKDCRAKCFSAPSWPANSSVSLASYYAGTASTCIYTGSHTGDYAIGLVWNLGSIAAGDSTVLTFAYVYNGLLGMDSAVVSPKISVNGSMRDSVDTVTACAFTGDTLWANVVNGNTADWTGSTWTWAPSTYLLTTSGVTNGILASTMTAPVTYTITGTPAVGGCGNKIFLLTVMPPGTTPPPTVHDTSFCQGAPSTAPITPCATGIGTPMWFTSPTGGVGSPVAPTPSTATPGTTTYYVSQVVAGCSSARVPVNVFIVTPAPPIAGPTDVCTGNCITVSNTTAGGTWASSNTAVGTVGSLTGIVCGLSAGTTTIDYMLGGSGCMVTTIVTVNQTPPAITGTVNVCATFTATLSNTLTGGTWTSAGPGVTFATPSSGVLTGVLGGPTTVTYTMPTGCYITRTQSVIPLPNPITGNFSKCVGTCDTLKSTSPGGIWSSGLPASGTPATSISTVGAATGYNCGISVGTATISYRINGCPTTVVVTVVNTPSAIGGSLTVCAGTTTSLTHASAGGTWSIAPASVATISSSGVVTGGFVGTTSTATVTYTLGGSCSVTAVVTVNPDPGAMSGSGTICIGNTTTLTHPTAGGTWAIGFPSSSGVPTGVATLASSGAGIVTGVAAGTATLSYTTPGGCVVTTVINVISTPSGITGTLSACSTGTSLLTSATSGGTWSSSSTGAATISSGGLVTAGVAGTSTISYTVGGCSTTAVFTTNANPGAITPASPVVCQSATTSLGSTPGGGTWSSPSSSVSVDLTTGVVTGMAPGTGTVTYTMAGGTGCYTTTTVTVNASPTLTPGATSLCLSGVSTFTVTPAGGTWFSSTPSVASVSSSGVVTASASTTGTTTISYALLGCSASVVVTVNSNPSISGLLEVCVGATRSLSASIPGGTWTMACPTIASIGASSGVASGLANGTCTVTYTAPGGCSSTAVLTVNAAPTAIVGGPSVCMGAPTTMSSTPTGGTWLASGSASIGLTSGVLTGTAAGTAVVTYTTPLTFCTTTKVVTVMAAPGTIGGPLAVCVASSTTLTNSVSGGTWTIGLPSTSGTPTSIATVNPTTGAVAGITAGTATITYNIGSTCVATAVVTVNPLPLPISGPLSLCLGMTGTLTSSVNAWSSSNASVAPIIYSTGVITGVSVGTTTIIDSLPTGCRVSAVVTVSAAPGPITGPSSVCIGQTITLANSTAGGTWSMACPTIGTISSTSGVFGGLSNGPCTVTYTPTSGCIVTTVVSVNALPTTISATSVCQGSNATLIGSPTGGTWSISPTTIATVNATTGSMYGVVTGATTTATATVTYTMGSGCFMTATASVEPTPSPITGPLATCIGSCAALGGSPAGGTWSITPSAIATVSSTGNVCGVAFGTATVTYTGSNGCSATRIMTVNTLPGPITGSGIACTGSATPYSNSATGGIWSISPTSVATVNASTGDVTGVIGATAGSTATLTYTVGTGCSVTTVVTLNTSPTPITGPTSICASGSATLSSSPTGGTWIAGSSCVSINPGTGAVTAGSGGSCSSIITYMLSSGCGTTTTVSVNPLPSIGGTMTICQGGTATLSGAPAGGTWSMTPASVATVSATSGAWYGVGAGTASVTYTAPVTGCSMTAVVTVTPLPAPITGSLYIALGGTTVLSSTPAGGTWTSSNTNATVTPPSTSGIIYGNNVGTATVTYTNGCSTTAVVTVDAIHSILGSLSVCETYTSTLSSSASGIIWSSSNIGVATIGASSGVVTGVALGTATISALNPSTGLTATRVVTVNALPGAISGPSNVCAGSSISLSTSSTTGTWSSSNTAAATVTSAGVVNGIAGYGTTAISYTLPSGCFVAQVVTVDSLPSVISGSSGFCNYTSSIYSASPTGGSWYSTNTAVATIDPSTGIATGVSVDSVTIIYTSAAGCSRSKLIDIIYGPSGITGPDHVCEGSTVTLGNLIAGGTWSSSTPAVGTVGITNGVVAGVNAGTTIISYKLSISSCTSTLIVTVDQTPGANFGVPVVCEGSTTTLFNAMGGGSWSSGNTAIASVDPATGVVTGVAGGTAYISYTSAAGCSTASIVTVNALPTPIAGSLSICLGSSSSLSSSPAGGSWWNSGTAVAIGFTSGVALGNNVGTSTITYTLPTGCFITAVATVFPVPSGNSGPTSVCEGASITLINTTGGGMWVSSNTAVATANPTTGVVTGVLAGTSNIIYQMPSGCSATTTVTVNTSPTITGALQVCGGVNTNLIGTPAGGTWTTTPGTSLIGTVNPMTGVVTGISGGNTGITYTLPVSSCHVEAIVTVNNLPPAIGGIPTVCVGQTTTLTNFAAGAGAAWSSSNTALATVTTASTGEGLVTGVSTGTVDITFTAPITGCINTRQVTVNPLPAPIAGTPVICADAVTTVTDATLGGTWSSAMSSIATVSPAGPGIGQVQGVTSGIVAISYTLPTGCFVTKDVTVSVTPPAIVGSGHVCLGSTRLLTNAMSGGVWTSSNPGVAPVSATGVVSGSALGTAVIVYALPTSGCVASKMVTVQPLPTVYSVTGGGSYCAGGTGVNVGLNGSQIGVSYALYYGASATGYMTGTNLPIDFGLMTLAGVYTIQATNPVSGCTNNMAGSTTVTITTPAVPTVNINSTPGDTVCPGSMATVAPIATNGGTAPTYVWKVNGVTVSSASAYSFIPADGDVVNVTMTSNSGCVLPATATATKVLHVAPTMMPSVSTVVDPGDTVCQYSLVTYMATSEYGGSAPSYAWLVNGTVAGSGSVFSYVPNDGDAIKCRMTSNYICRLTDVVESGTVAMVVDSMIVPHIHVTPYPGYAVSSGTAVTFAAAVTDAGSDPTFQWYINGVPVAGAINDTFVSSTLNHYDSVVCRVTSSGVCHDVSAYDWAFISISPLSVAHMNAAADIRLIPNPNNGTFTIKGTWGSTDEDITLEVTNMIGQVVYSGKIDARNGKVNESVHLNGTLANGMYMLNMRTNNDAKVFHFVMEQQ